MEGWIDRRQWREGDGMLDIHDGKLRIAFKPLGETKWWRLTWRGFVLGHYSSLASACKFAAAYKGVVG